MIPRSRITVLIDLDPELNADGAHRVGIFQAEVVGHENVGVGQERARLLVGEGQLKELGIVLQLGPRARQLVGRRLGGTVTGVVVPEEPLERRVHQGALDGIGAKEAQGDAQ